MRVLLALLLCAVASPAHGQQGETRIREISNRQWGAPAVRVRMVATDDMGILFGVRVRAVQGIDAVDALGSVREALAFAARFDSVDTAVQQRRTGETLEIDAGGFAAIDMTKVLSASGVQYRLRFSDRYDVNVTRSTLSRASAREFVNRLAATARAAAEMNHIDPVSGEVNPLYDPVQRTYWYVGDVALKVLHRTACPAGQQLVSSAERSASVRVVFFNSLRDARAAGYDTTMLGDPCITEGTTIRRPSTRP